MNNPVKYRVVMLALWSVILWAEILGLVHSFFGQIASIIPIFFIGWNGWLIRYYLKRGK